mmetsp:Transcript_10334/g.34483  ORF Transcript_10334/g.34483 Transcript_10334/m.34483 type:complete len:227 (+) Transcript_10334:146-826(+)
MILTKALDEDVESMIEMLYHSLEVLAFMNNPLLGSSGEKLERPGVVPSELPLGCVDFALGLITESDVPVYMCDLRVVRSEYLRDSAQCLVVPLERLVHLIKSLESIADVVLRPPDRGVIFPENLHLVFERVLVLAESLHVFAANVMHVAHGMDDIGYVEVWLVAFHPFLEHLEGLLIEVVGLVRVLFDLSQPFFLRSNSLDVLSFELIGLTHVHKREREVRVNPLT